MVNRLLSTQENVPYEGKNQQLVGGKLEVGDSYYAREQFYTPLILELLLLCKHTVSGFWSLLLHTSMPGQNPV